MKIRLLAVGQKMPTWVKDTFNQYNIRLPRNQQIELKEIPPAHRSRSANSESGKKAEGECILSALKETERLVLLDEKGKLISTKDLSACINEWQMDSQDIAIVIGGADGVSEEVKKRANITWSLSKLTFPHPMVRIIIMEQIYRAYSLLSNHPYHRE